MPSEALLMDGARVQRLQAAYEQIARTRMAGLPICNPVLTVEVIGFETATGPGRGETGCLGVLLTPWCMNLVWLSDMPPLVPAPGESRHHDLGGNAYAFIGARDEVVGPFETCSLFSPVFEFPEPAIARGVALEVLRCLRQPVEQVERPSRRRWLMGAGALAADTR